MIDLDALVVEIRLHSSSAALDLALTVGRIVVERIFAGSLDEWRLEGEDNHSLRRLAEHPSLPFSATSLHRSIRAYELSQRFPELARWRDRIGLTHIRSVLGLEPHDQRALLELAYRQHWTVERMELEAATRRSEGHGRRGRPRLPLLVKIARRLRRTAEEQRSQLELDIDANVPFDDLTLLELRSTILALEETVRHLQQCVVGGRPEPSASSRHAIDAALDHGDDWPGAPERAAVLDGAAAPPAPLVASRRVE